MSEDQGPDAGDRFEERLRTAQARRTGPHAAKGSASVPKGRSLGLAFRIGVELVAALIVGIGAGWLLDGWLGTEPWLFILFFFLGAAAGVMNVWRTVDKMGRDSGEAG